MPKIYKSKVSGRIICLVCLIALLPVVPVIYFAFSWVAILAIFFLFALIFYCMFSVRYIIEDTTLRIKCGFFLNEKVDIMKITKITETSSILSAPAASLDRIAIYLRRQYSPVIISPENKNEFIEELQSINPDITKI